MQFHVCSQHELLLKPKGENLILRKNKTTAKSNQGLDLEATRAFDCLVGVECLLDVVRALGFGLGSCLSADATAAVASMSSSSSSAAGVGLEKKRKKYDEGIRRNPSLDSKREDWLRRIPGRTFLNGATQTGVASLFTKQGKKGINQDAMIIWENFGSKEDAVFCGVFDGHGPYGHMVSRRVRDALPLKLSAQWALGAGSKYGLSDISSSATGSMNSEEIPFTSFVKDYRTSIDRDYEDNHPDVLQTLTESFLKAFKVMDKELKLHSSIDCFFSGTTAVALVKQGHDLVIGNVGDSRAVLGTRDKDDSLIAVQLTMDLKPNLPREAERIRRCRGRVFALRNEPDVARVWLPNSDSPGLAMARAFGDFCLKDFGLISVPEISHHRLTEKDEFVVLATDGVWDVLSNNEAVNIVASAPRSYAARTLVKSAIQAWKYIHPTSKVDDCAAVCLFLNTNSYNSCTSNPDFEG